MMHQAESKPSAPRERNLVALLERQVREHGALAAVKHKREGRWQDVSWSELARRARDVSDGLAALGIAPGDRVAVIGDTNLEWMIADLGILGTGAATATIYQSNQPEECRYILEHSGARLVFCDSAAQVAKIRAVKDRLPRLEGIVRAQGPAADGFERTLAELERAGAEWRKAHPRAHEERVARIGPDDASTLIYTSGTTGNPKGIVLTHGNWTYLAAAVGDVRVVNPEDVVLLFLPMAHSFAKDIQAAWLGTGCSCAFVESLDKIMDNASEVRPTVMPAVPRIFEKAYNTVVAKGYASPGIKGRLFRMAMESFGAYADARERGRNTTSFGLALARRLVFPKLTAALNERFGGRMRFFVSGGAPLSPRIAWFFDELGFTILEGYGLSESSGAAFVNRPERNRIGTVGPPLPGSEVRIAEDGEILIRGPGVMKGYWNDPAATAEALRDGWLVTGDIGQVEGDCLRITDRKKDIIVTAGGKNVAPQNLESELKTDPLVSQAMVHGDRRRFLSAILTLNADAARKWASENGIPPTASLHDHPAMIARIQQVVDAVNARQASYSTIKRFAIAPADFTQESGELTPTLKVKRKVVTQRYLSVLDAFYRE